MREGQGPSSAAPHGWMVRLRTRPGSSFDRLRMAGLRWTAEGLYGQIEIGYVPHFCLDCFIAIRFSGFVPTASEWLAP